MSWQQLQAICAQDQEQRAFFATQPPRSCPNDGTPLTAGPGGTLHCPFDGYSWPGDGALPGQAGGG